MYYFAGPAGESDENHDNSAAVSRETEETQGRKYSEMSENEIDKFISSQQPKNTIRKTKSDMKIFRDWLKASPRFELRAVEVLDTLTLNNYLRGFILGIRKPNNEEYEPTTLDSYFRSIDRYLKVANYGYSINRDHRFSNV